VGTDGTIRALGKCLDVSGGLDRRRGEGQLWDCNGTGAQQWVANAARDIVNPQANKCLDATGPSSADGTPLQIWSCGGGANQKWTVPSGGGSSSGFVVSEAQFNQMFPNRNSFYTYAG
jgi:Ricin-type beta-trefoil lectin domain.